MKNGSTGSKLKETFIQNASKLLNDTVGQFWWKIKTTLGLFISTI